MDRCGFRGAAVGQYGQEFNPRRRRGPFSGRGERAAASTLRAAARCKGTRLNARLNVRPRVPALRTLQSPKLSKGFHLSYLSCEDRQPGGRCKHADPRRPSPSLKRYKHRDMPGMPSMRWEIYLHWPTFRDTKRDTKKHKAGRRRQTRTTRFIARTHQLNQRNETNLMTATSTAVSAC